ncbi:DNA adenine methylase [Helicobacter monodelphidis]|uniref:DNA adenine methylase n=1 Tax=Helicobacter sp. 15-1451 TaxID=2004995 RepID=UPI00215D165A|nr:DNA adenine methylase [Helicobacter sp. 15-1451]
MPNLLVFSHKDSMRDKLHIPKGDCLQAPATHNPSSFKLSSRRYTGAKTKLLEKIDSVISKHCLESPMSNLKARDTSNTQSLHNTTTQDCIHSSNNQRVFFDVFGGTGVVSEYFMRKRNNMNDIKGLRETKNLCLGKQDLANISHKKSLEEPSKQDSIMLSHETSLGKLNKQNSYNDFNHFIINDFLYSNYTIYQGFFLQSPFDRAKIESLREEYQKLDSKKIIENYYSKHFGERFFSKNDSKIIGHIRDDLDTRLKAQTINHKEFYILLSSLLYSADRIANTVGHYDAYRKNIILENRFIFQLIEPIITDKKIEIFREDSNALVAKMLKMRRDNQEKFITCAFIDPPYNSRQYSRFYHLLETLSKNDKPKLYGIAQKPNPENISKYCKVEAKEAFKDLVTNLAQISKNIVVTYNNTYTSHSASSQNKMQLDDIRLILESCGKIHIYEFDYKAFSSGKTDFKGHKEFIFISETR